MVTLANPFSGRCVFFQASWRGFRIESKKARRGHPLTVLEKVLNRLMSTLLRMPVEHAIGHLKKYRLLAGIYRGREEHYDESALVIAGLHDYKELGGLSW